MGRTKIEVTVETWTISARLRRRALDLACLYRSVTNHFFKVDSMITLIHINSTEINCQCIIYNTAVHAIIVHADAYYSYM